MSTLSMARLTADNTMLMVIDMQDRLQPTIDGDQAMRARANALAAGFGRLGAKVLVTEQYPQGLGSTVAELAEAAKASGGALPKTCFSAVDEPTIAAKLQATNAKNIVLAGAEAHICVLQTALDLMSRGYRVLLAEDAIGARDPVNMRTGLERAKAEGAIAANTEMLLFELLRDATHPAFKDVQALIK